MRIWNFTLCSPFSLHHIGSKYVKIQKLKKWHLGFFLIARQYSHHLQLPPWCFPQHKLLSNMKKYIIGHADTVVYSHHLQLHPWCFPQHKLLFNMKKYIIGHTDTVVYSALQREKTLNPQCKFQEKGDWRKKWIRAIKSL